MPLAQLIYCSRPVLAEAQRSLALAAILEAAIHHNAANGISGCLGHSREWFLQVLEGEENAVQETFDRIARDPRHNRVQTLMRRAIKARSFPEWSMASIDLAAASPATLPGVGLDGPLSPDTTPPARLLMVMMDLADRKRLQRSA